jgi:YD repeat-containing protein
MGGIIKTEWQFVWSARYVDAPVLRDRSADLDNSTGSLGKSGSGLEQRLYYATDANMNVTALINTDGTVAERYRYDPYGNVTVLDADWGIISLS